MKGAIVTGAGGFVGGALVEALAAEGVKVLAIGRRDLSARFMQTDKVTAMTMDVADIRRLPEMINYGDYDVFYHFAWAGNSGSGRADTDLQLKNAAQAIDCVRAAKAVGCERFIAAGSLLEKEILELGLKNGTKPAPGQIYGASKLAAHFMSKCVAAEIGISHIWCIITNAYGAGELSPRLINSTLRKIKKGESPQFSAGTQNYDFVYVTDVAGAFIAAGKYGKPFCEYTIGSGKAKPLKEFLLEIRDVAAPELEFCFDAIPMTGAKLDLSVFDTASLRADTGFEPKVSFREGIKRTLRWLDEEK